MAPNSSHPTSPLTTGTGTSQVVPVCALLLIALISRAVVPAVFGFLDQIRDQPHDTLREFVLSHYHAWDAGWYYAIARDGYDASTPQRLAGGQTAFAFYPLMPLLTRWIGAIGHWDLRLTGIVLSHLYFAGAVVLFHCYCRRRLGPGAETSALWATALMAFAPHGFIYSFFYTESLFVLLALATITCLDRQHPIAAGIFGALLTATRANGIFIGIFFLYPVLRHIVIAIRRRDAASDLLNNIAPLLLGGALVPLGLVAFWSFCLYSTGDAFAQAHSLSVGWDWSSQPPWRNFVELYQNEKYEVRFLLAWSAAALVAALLLARRWPAEFLFCLLNLLLFASGSLEQSLLRYCMALFPLYLGLAAVVGRQPALLAALLALFATTNTLLLHAWDSRHLLGI